MSEPFDVTGRLALDDRKIAAWAIATGETRVAIILPGSVLTHGRASLPDVDLSQIVVMRRRSGLRLLIDMIRRVRRIAAHRREAEARWRTLGEPSMMSYILRANARATGGPVAG